MAKFKITGPDGRTYEVNAPEGATSEQVMAFARQKFGGTPAAGTNDYQKFADREARDRKAQAEARELYDPTKGNNFGQNMLEGVGSGMTSVIRALGGSRIAKALDLPETAEEAKVLDAPLLNTAGGTVGDIIGKAAPAALAIPFTPASLPVAAGAGLGARAAAVAIPQVLAGAVTGGAMTEGDAGNRAGGALGGALGGAISSAIPKLWGIGKGVTRALFEPATSAGRDRIVGRAIERFATNPGGLRNAPMGPSVTGAQPTLAEALQDRGLATLQRAVGTMSPEADEAIAARYAANNAARVGRMEERAGMDQVPGTSMSARQNAIAARSNEADPLYSLAWGSGWDPSIGSEEGVEAMRRLLGRFDAPLQTEARKRATRAGATYDPFQVATDPSQVQWLNRALNSDIAKDLAKGVDVQESMMLKGALDNALEQYNPALRSANQAYSTMSAPIDRMNVWDHLLNTTRSQMESLGTADAPGVRQIQPNAFARAMNNGEQTVMSATGRGGAGLDRVMGDPDMALLTGIQRETSTAAKLADAANGGGSQTAKMLNAQQLLRSLTGPLGIPDGFLDTTVGDILMRTPDLAYKFAGANKRVGDRLGDAALDPALAIDMVRRARAYDAVTPPTPIRIGNYQVDPLSVLMKRSAPALAGTSAAQAASE